MKERRFGVTQVLHSGTEEAWYVIVTPPFAAVCTHHGPPHLHRHALRRHPDHLPSVPLAPDLRLPEVLARLNALCAPIPRGPTVKELQEALS